MVDDAKPRDLNREYTQAVMQIGDLCYKGYCIVLDVMNLFKSTLAINKVASEERKAKDEAAAREAAAPAKETVAEVVQ